MDGCSYRKEPLEMILTIEETVKLMDKVTGELSSSCYASIKPSILSLSFNLKRHGPSLEQLHASHLKRLHQAMRSSCRDPRLDLVSRVHLLEIIELRSLNWVASQHVTNFYKMKLDEIKELSEVQSATTGAQSNCSKPSSRLNVNAPDFCLSMSVSKPVYGSLDIMTVQDEIGNKDVITEHGDSISKGTFTVQEDYSSREVFFPQGDYVGKETTAVQGNYGSKDENNIIIKEAFAVQCDNDIKTSATVHTTDGEITLTSKSMDLLHSAKKILEEGLKDKIAVKTVPSQTTSLNVSSEELISKRHELLELAESHLSKLPPIDKEKIDKEIPCIVKIKPRVK